MAKRVMLLVGTKKGAFILDGDAGRSGWALRGPFCETWPINEVIADPKTGVIWAAGGNEWFGPAVWRSKDFGATWTHSSAGLAYAAGGANLSATLFQRHSRDLITFVSCASLGRCADRPDGLYDNVARARAKGLELAADASLARNLTAGLAYAFTQARNRSGVNPGKQLARRPHHALTTSLDWAGERFSLGADLRWVSASFDDAANTRRMGGHALVALRAEVPVSENLLLFGRVENLTDTRYETVADYGTWGRAAFVGVRAEY